MARTGRPEQRLEAHEEAQQLIDEARALLADGVEGQLLDALFTQIDELLGQMIEASTTDRRMPPGGAARVASGS